MMRILDASGELDEAITPAFCDDDVTRSARRLGLMLVAERFPASLANAMSRLVDVSAVIPQGCRNTTEPALVYRVQA